jgi:hypothetical protein
MPGPTGVSKRDQLDSDHPEGKGSGEIAMIESAAAVVSVGLVGLRFAGVKTQAFQAIAHLWVGMGIGVWVCGAGMLYGWLVIGMSVAEVIAFVISKKTDK